MLKIERDILVFYSTTPSYIVKMSNMIKHENNLPLKIAFIVLIKFLKKSNNFCVCVHYFLH